MLLVILLTCLPAVGQSLPDGEREFVQRLCDLEEFDLAEQYCREQMQFTQNADLQADWELQLSACVVPHVWLMAADSRNETIRQGIQRITDFLAGSPVVSADRSLLLRVRQLELLTTMVHLESLLHSPVSWQARDVSRVETMPQSPAVPPRSALITGAETECLSAAQTILQQLEEKKREFRPEVLRFARESVRLFLARTEFCRAQSTLALETARERIDGLLKLAAEPALLFEARVLEAEWLIAAGDESSLRLRLRGLDNDVEGSEQRARVVALRIRDLLSRNQPSDALQLYVDFLKTREPVSQELRSLQLQCLLQLLELLFSLDDQGADETKARTAADFELARRQALAVTRGAWRERCDRIARRFERVRQVGPAIATALERISLEVESGDLSAARRNLEQVLAQQQTQPGLLTATLQLQLGDLAVRQQDWNAAESVLGQSAEAFRKVEAGPRAAAADLLRIYALGQQWSRSDSTNSESIGEDRAAYQAALDDYLIRYAGQLTTAQVYEWRAMFRRPDDPLAAAEDAMAAAGVFHEQHKSPADNSHHRESVLLDLAGRYLCDAHLLRETDPEGAPSQESSDRRAEILQAFGKMTDPILQVDSSVPDLVTIQLRLRRLLLDVLAGKARDWKRISENSRSYLTALLDPKIAGDRIGAVVDAGEIPAPVSNAEQQLSESIRDCHVLIVAGAYRQLLQPSEFADSRSFLSSLRGGDQTSAIQTLAYFVKHADATEIGNSQLAHFILQLLDSPDESADHQKSVTRQLEELRIIRDLSPVLGSEAAFEQRLRILLSAPLTTNQLEAVAQQISGLKPETAQASRPAVVAFWKRVQASSRQGDQTWLEASLQLAGQAAEENAKEALRILSIVEALHPDWGKAERKARAEQLRRRLEPRP